MTASLVPGVLNFRDTGGLPAGAAETRSGVLYRSGNLVRAGETSGLADLGVRRIVDLRADDEVERDPSQAGEIPVVRVPLFLGSVASFFQNDQSLDDMYRAMIDTSADRIVTAVRALVEPQPVLVHCTVGKDRTGVTVAIALAAAGVDRDAVIADYARTESFLPAERNAAVQSRLRAMYPDMRHLEQLTSLSPAPVMSRLLADLDGRFGSPADFLRAGGVTDDELLGLRDALVAAPRTTL